MSKHCCILCSKEVASDQKCVITVEGKSPGLEEKKEVCLECMLTALGISDSEQTKGTDNE